MGPRALISSPILRESAAPSPGSIACVPTPCRPAPPTPPKDPGSLSAAQSDGTFDKGTWVDLNYQPGNPLNTPSISQQQFGLWRPGRGLGDSTERYSTTFSFQATVNIDFQLSNVISANTGNGINISGSNGNVIAMNYIGTDPAGTSSTGFGNGANGILITGASFGESHWRSGSRDQQSDWQ